MNNLFQVGDQVVLNDVPLEPGDNHKLLKPGTRGVVSVVGRLTSKGWGYKIKWAVPDNVCLSSGWWVYEKNVDFAILPISVDAEELL